MSDPGDSWLLARQPILDRGERVVAYELLFRSTRGKSADVQDPTRATASVILSAVWGFGLEEVLGGHRGFINVDEATLLRSEALDVLPRELVVLEILESVEPTHEVAERCRELSEAGYALALDDHRYDPRFDALYPLIEIIKVDLTRTPEAELELELERLRRFPVTVLAEKVETSAQFRRCFDLGYDLFQGYHFARPALLERRRIDEGTAALLRVLQLVQRDADLLDIEAAVRTSPSLSYKLLVLVNSVAMRARERILSLRQAITMLGRNRLRRWVQLALFASATPSAGTDEPLVDLAATRAVFMEALAERLAGARRARGMPEQAYMTGILSLFDALFAVSVPELVANLRLSDDIAGALLGRGGLLGELLAAAESLERMEIEDAVTRLEALGLDRDAVLAAQRRAFGWRDGL